MIVQLPHNCYNLPLARSLPVQSCAPIILPRPYPKLDESYVCTVYGRPVTAFHAQIDSFSIIFTIAKDIRTYRDGATCCISRVVSMAPVRRSLTAARENPSQHPMIDIINKSELDLRSNLLCHLRFWPLGGLKRPLFSAHTTPFNIQSQAVGRIFSRVLQNHSFSSR